MVTQVERLAKQSPVTKDAGAPEVAHRHALVEAEVAAGLRDARSLIAISAEAAKRATLTFPKDAFGPPQAW
ncbi:MAG: hypothetical protein JSR75_19795 [Proteobacteria bacterium]|nr:hypothetical protein [Pseudomonadota bacterium]